MTVESAGETNQASVCLIDHYALEFGADGDTADAAIYDLEEMSWWTSEEPRAVTLKTAEKQAEDSRTQLRLSRAKSQDTAFNLFVDQLINPKFDIQEEQGTLSMKSPAFNYRMSGRLALDPLQRRRLLDYDRLNAYRKSQMESKTPPFVQLAIDDELERRDLTPARYDVDLRTPAARVKFTIQFEVVRPDEAGVAELRRRVDEMKKVRTGG